MWVLMREGEFVSRLRRGPLPRAGPAVASCSFGWAGRFFSLFPPFAPAHTLRRMTKVRMGIIGMGNIGQHHHGYLSAGKVSRAELTAVSDAIPGKLEKYKPLKIFSDGEELIRSGLVDAVIIATPHYQHTTLGISALRIWK